jgi:hypothetical protein
MHARREPGFFNNQPVYTITDLLNQAGQGNEEEVLKITRTNPELLKQSGNFTDMAGYEFTNISFMKYVAWAWDVRYMAGKVIQSLPDDEQGMEIKKALVEQLAQLKNEGATYNFKGKLITGERRFDIEPLLAAILTFYNNASNWTQTRQDEYCNTIIGMLQNHLPAYIRQEYCVPNRPFCNQNSDDSADDADDYERYSEDDYDDDAGKEMGNVGNETIDNPIRIGSDAGICTFEDVTIERTLKFYNQEADERMIWDANLAGLGTNFSIGRAVVVEEAQGCGSGMTEYELIDDYKALKKLSTRRLTDLEELIQNLKQSTLQLGQSINNQ